jgi:biotin carboxylase
MKKIGFMAHVVSQGEFRTIAVPATRHVQSVANVRATLAGAGYSDAEVKAVFPVYDIDSESAAFHAILRKASGIV